jgi:hypothetical protein
MLSMPMAMACSRQISIAPFDERAAIRTAPIDHWQILAQIVELGFMAAD